MFKFRCFLKHKEPGWPLEFTSLTHTVVREGVALQGTVNNGTNVEGGEGG